MASRFTLAFLLTGIFCFSIACGSGGNGTHSSQQQAVSILLNPAPASTSVPAGNTTGIKFTAVVSNDSNNNGVDWALTCSLSSIAGACGNLNINNFHSASGATVSYIPPTILPGGSLTVNVTAFATADHTKNVNTGVTVTSYTNVLSGNYVLQVLGSDATPQPYQSTGVFVFDGKGNITSGQQTLNTINNSITAGSAVYTLAPSSVAPSTYFIGPDGRGAITLNVQNAAASLLTETYSLVVLSSSKALIAELNVISPSATGTGSLELQDSKAAATMPTGAYAFVTQGSDAGSSAGPGLGTPVPTAMGGVLNIDNNPSLGSISGNGSLADQDYYKENNGNFNRKLQSCVPPTGLTGNVSQPSALGVVTIALTGATCFGLTSPALIQFTGYIVDATHIRLIESDDVNGSAGFLTAGIAVSQVAGTFTNASLYGPYVLGVLGYDLNNGATGFSFTSAAVLTADGNGNLTGITDTFYPSEPKALSATPLTGTYAMDANLIGRALLTPKFTGSPHPKPNVLLYMTGDGTLCSPPYGGATTPSCPPPLVLWSEGEDVNFPAIGSGIAYSQAANPSSFSFGNSQTYGVGFTQNSPNSGSATMTSAINGASGTLTGTLDDFNNNDILSNITPSSSPSPPLALLDTFALPADIFGRISGTFMNKSGSLGPYVEYYFVDGNQGFLVETDLSNLTVTSSGVTLGYFAQACDVTSSTSCAAPSQPSASKRSSSRIQRKRPN